MLSQKLSITFQVPDPALSVPESQYFTRFEIGCVRCSARIYDSHFSKDFVLTLNAMNAYVLLQAIARVQNDGKPAPCEVRLRDCRERQAPERHG